MIDAAPLVGTLFLALAALAGLVIVQNVIAARDPFEPINRRFLFGLRVMMMLFAGRALQIITGSEFFRFFILLGAALIPLVVLLLVEGLLRRHAPLWAKYWVGLGCVVFGLSAFWWSTTIDPARLVGLLVFQISGLVVGGYLVLSRDKASLSQSENRAVERLALSLVLLIPLAASDFLLLFIGLPLQVSPLGVLFLCWLAVSLGRSQVQHRGPLASFLAILLGVGLSGAFISVMAGLDKDATILTISVILAAVLVAVLFIEAQSLRAEEQSASLLRHLAEDRSPDGLTFLRHLQSHPLVEGAVLIDQRQLQDLDADVLDRLFAEAPVLRRADPPFSTGLEGDHIDHLFRLYNASHILLVDAAPMSLVALSMPALAASPRAEMELAVVQRMARLMSSGAA